jgi:signal transduction histidine kinase
VLTVALAAALSLSFVMGLWAFHERAHEVLDRELGIRLRNVATTAAATVPADSLLVWIGAERSPLWLLLLEQTLERVERDNDLSRILVYESFDNRVVIDTAHLVRRGEVDPFLSLDLGAVAAARQGLAGYSRLQRLDDNVLKAGYAPVLDLDDEVSGYVGVIASAGFFATLAQLRTTLLVVGTSVVAAVWLLTFGYLAYARRLARARSALQRSETLSAMGRMAAGIAHEIRNPLGIIKNAAQLLREELIEARRPTDLVDYIPEEVDRLSQTLASYLDFARDAPVQFEDVDLSHLVRRTLRLMERDLEQAHVQVVDNLDRLGQLSLRGDPRRLQQVLLNLFLNAMQAMPEGGQLRIQLEADEQDLTLMLDDSGVGMGPTQVAHAFEPFVTTKEKGSGLGLTIAQRIINEHRGRIEIQSEPGEGTTVWLVLPRSVR